MPSRTFDLSVIFKVLDKATGPIRSIGNAFKGLENKTASLKGKFESLGKSFSGVGKKMKDVGKDFSTKLTLPLTVFGGLAVRSAISFQEAMNMAGAVSSATADQMVAMTDIAKQLGATTQFSATQAAEGFKFLGMAGLSVDESIKALPRTLELAASAQMDLGTAADIVTNIMSGYRYQAEDLVKVNDVLVNTFTSSNTDLAQLGEAMGKVGPVARGLQYRFTETAAALGVLASNAFQGTLGGTGLARIMVNLVSPSKKAAEILNSLGIRTKNADGGLRSLTEVVKDFEAAQAKGASETMIAAAAMEVFGQRGGPQFIALLGAGSKALEELEEKLKRTGTTAKVSEAQMKGLPGAFKLLKSAFEGLQLAIVDSGIGETLGKIVRGLADVISKISKWNPMVLKVIAILGILVALIGPLLIGFGMIAASIGAMVAFIPALIPLLPVLLGITAAIIAIGAAAYLMWRYWDEIEAITGKIADFGATVVHWILNPIGAATEKIFGMQRATTGLLGVLNKIVAPFEKFVSTQIKFVLNPIGGAIKGIKYLSNALGGGGSESPQSPANAISTVGGTSKSQTDVNIKVTSDQGSTATIEQVKPKKGDANVNVSTIGYVGAF